MATAASKAAEPGEARETRESDQRGGPLVVVDLGEAQSVMAVKRLRRGKGKLFQHVEHIVSDLVSAGTVKPNAQPVVIVVREMSGVWPFRDLDD
jgi:hypothetical protein